MVRLIDRFIAHVSSRAPDFQIGGSENPYCNRWWVIPRNRLFNIYLHQFVRDDDDRALHDHPWVNCSIVLRGGYTETRFSKKPRKDAPLPEYRTRWRGAGSVTFRRASTAHRVILMGSPKGRQPSWSLFLTGPVMRSWGFWCPLGRWVHWRDFVSGPRGETVGKGCE